MRTIGHPNLKKNIFSGGNPVNPDDIGPLPPNECIPGNPETAAVLINCDENGQAIPPSATKSKKVTPKDKFRAETKVPGHDYRGVDFGSMSAKLNGWLNATKHRQDIYIDIKPMFREHIKKKIKQIYKYY